MTDKILFIPILIPFVAGLLVLIFPGRWRRVKEGISLTATVANLLAAAALFGNEITCVFKWFSPGLDFSLRLYHFSAFIMWAAAGFGMLPGHTVPFGVPFGHTIPLMTNFESSLPVLPS